VSIDVAIATSDQYFIGEHKVVQFTVYQPGSTSDDIADDSAPRQDITGWTISFVLQDNTNTAVVTKTTGSGIAITDAPNGVLQVTLNAVDTSGLTAGTFHLIVKRTDVGSESILSRGPASLQQP
jgi:hypothetical protein